MQRCQRQNQARRLPKPQLPEQLLCWKDGPSTGKATTTTCMQQSQEFGMEQGRGRKFFNSVTDLEKCECPSKAQRGAFPASG